ICSSDLTMLSIAHKARMSSFQQMWRNRKRLLAKLSSGTDQLRHEIETAGPDVLVEFDRRRLNTAVDRLLDVIEDTSVRWRASQSMAETARHQPYPGALSLSLNDRLTPFHRRWNQQTRDLIVAACLQACRAYPAKDKIAQ